MRVYSLTCKGLIVITLLLYHCSTDLGEVRPYHGQLADSQTLRFTVFFSIPSCNYSVENTNFSQAAEHCFRVISGVLVQSYSFNFTFMNAMLLSVMGWLKFINFCDLSCVILNPTVQGEMVFHTTHCTPVCNPHLSFSFFFFLICRFTWMLYGMAGPFLCSYF